MQSGRLVLTVEKCYAYCKNLWIVRNKTMANKLMYIPTDDAQNYPFGRLQLLVEPFEHSTYWTNSMKVPKVVRQTHLYSSNFIYL